MRLSFRCSQTCLTFYFLLAVCAFLAKLGLQKGSHLLLALLSAYASVAIKAFTLAAQTISGLRSKAAVYADTRIRYLRPQVSLGASTGFYFARNCAVCADTASYVSIRLQQDRRQNT